MCNKTKQLPSGRWFFAVSLLVDVRRFIKPHQPYPKSSQIFTYDKINRNRKQIDCVTIVNKTFDKTNKNTRELLPFHCAQSWNKLSENTESFLKRFPDTITTKLLFNCFFVFFFLFVKLLLNNLRPIASPQNSLLC